MNRIKETFDQLKNINKKAVGIFLTAGDPDFESSFNLIQKLPKNGVDFIEIGMPNLLFYVSWGSITTYLIEIGMHTLVFCGGWYA